MSARLRSRREGGPQAALSLTGTTYAVSWRDAEGSTDSGRLELGPDRLRLEGAETVEIVYEELSAVAIGRDTLDRLAGRTTIILSHKSGQSLWVAPVAQRTTLLELFDRVSTLCS